jgi:hypothetical protein
MHLVGPPHYFKKNKLWNVMLCIQKFSDLEEPGAPVFRFYKVGITCHKAVLFIVTTVMTSNLRKHEF